MTVGKISISFSGCGFLGMYHVGSLVRWKEAKASDGIEIAGALGASAGALVAAALVMDLPSELFRQKILSVASKVRSLGVLGPFHPGFDTVDLLKSQLDALLPEEAHLRASGKLFVSLTDSAMQNVIVSRFANRQEVRDALVCSCYLPAFSSYRQVPTFRGNSYLDGGFSDNQPVLDQQTTVRVSPFAGGSHICPSDGPADERPFLKKWGGEPIHLSANNMKRLYDALMPPENLDQLYKQGYEHTDAFIRSDKMKRFFRQ